jgi:hypothetical protein
MVIGRWLQNRDAALKTYFNNKQFLAALDVKIGHERGEGRPISHEEQKLAQSYASEMDNARANITNLDRNIERFEGTVIAYAQTVKDRLPRVQPMQQAQFTPPSASSSSGNSLILWVIEFLFSLIVLGITVRFIFKGLDYLDIILEPYLLNLLVGKAANGR